MKKNRISVALVTASIVLAINLPPATPQKLSSSTDGFEALKGRTEALAHSVLLLQIRLDKLADELERLKTVSSAKGGYSTAKNIIDLTRIENIEFLRKLLNDTQPLTSEDVAENKISGFGDFFMSTVKNKLPGVSFDATYSPEISSNLHGGLRRKTVYLDNVDLTVTLDMEKLFGWNGGSFFFYGLGNNGGSPSEFVGDVQTVSNIDADDAWKLYEFWFQQELLGGRLSLLTGLYDLNSEFDVIETAGLFLNSSQGIGPDFSQTGLNGPSIFPNSSLGLRVKLQPTNNFYIQTVVLDGVPGNPDDPGGAQINFSRDDGILLGAEMAYLSGTEEQASKPYSKIALGMHYYTTRFEMINKVDITGNPVLSRSKPGFYLLAERTIFREDSDPTQGLALFGRVGFADSKINQFGYYTGAGLVYTGLFSGRHEDRIGFAVASVYNGSKFKQAQHEAGNRVDNSEIALELTYRSQITPWLAVQPDLQYVINPGTVSTTGNAIILGTRLELSF